MTRWQIVMNRDELATLRQNSVFRGAILLARACNLLRFGLAAGLDQGNADGSAHARQRAGSFFLLSAVLEELFKRAIPSLRERLSHLDGWTQLEHILQSEQTSALRKAALERLRNKAVFHLEDAMIEEGLAALPNGEYALAHGDSTAFMDVYFDFADRVAAAFASADYRAPGGSDSFQELVGETITITKEVLSAADVVLGQAWDALGLALEQDHSDGGWPAVTAAERGGS